MKARLGHRLHALAGTAFLAAVLLAGGGCEFSQEPLAPQPAAVSLQGGVAGGFSTDGLLAFLQPPDLSGPRTASALIRAAKGGSVDLDGFRVDVPAGALRADTWITITLPASLPESGYVVADYGPSGLRFTKPVTLTLPLRGVELAGIDLSTVGVSYWNGSAWEDYGGAATSVSVQATTSHFSTYGARSARKGGIDTTSGG